MATSDVVFLVAGAPVPHVAAPPGTRAEAPPSGRFAGEQQSRWMLGTGSSKGYGGTRMDQACLDIFPTCSSTVRIWFNQPVDSDRMKNSAIRAITTLAMVVAVDSPTRSRARDRAGPAARAAPSAKWAAPVAPREGR